MSACALALEPLPARAGRAVPREVNLRPPVGMRSVSVGYTYQGKLLRGMRAKQSEYVRYVGEYVHKGHFYGTWELVQLLERAARRVAFRIPGARLSIGELSAEGGGRIDGHRSHESGRDVDIGFYMTLPDGSSASTYAFAGFDRRGQGLAPNQYLRFDDARNWELIAKLLTDGEARVQYVFVANYLKHRLLAEGARRNASEALLERVRSALVEPAHGHPHRNHFHVRIYCAPADRALCRDRAPFWSWYPGQAPASGYAKLASPLGIDAP